MLSKAELIAFEDEVAAAKVPFPTHLSGGNEDQLIEIFREVHRGKDWIFTSYRNHYHALLYGIPRALVMEQILAGRSMTPSYPNRRFFSSALVCGQVPPAVGVAAAIKRKGLSERVWCFVGDMGATMGIFFEGMHYAAGHALPIVFVVEDNGLACDTPTEEVWGRGRSEVIRYRYKRDRPHLGSRA